MYTYRSALETDEALIHQAFTKGFSDYMIKFDISRNDFMTRFFGQDGNNLRYSYVAFHHEEPVGVILGGIKEFDGVKTMRCGALSVSPEHRGTGISDRLLELHIDEAKRNGCRQLFLEVIRGNERAIAFYRKHGYEIVYDLSYYTLSKTDKAPESSVHENYRIRKTSLGEVQSLKKRFSDLHLNWQTDFHAMEKIEDMNYYAAYHEETIIGLIAYRLSGKIFFIWVDPEKRNQYIGSQLLGKALEEDISKLHISFSNHAGLRGFVKAEGFTLDELSQYEMYRLL